MISIKWEECYQAVKNAYEELPDHLKEQYKSLMKCVEDIHAAEEEEACEK